MAKFSFKHYTFGALALSSALFVGCMGSDTQGPAPEQYGSVSVSIGTGVVTGSAKSGLSKGSTIALSKLIVTMISNATPADTVNDTIVPGEQGFVSSATTPQSIDSSYVLKALRTWYITVKTLDTQDSVVHIKTDSIVRLLAGDVRPLSMSLTPRFVMYKANFNFPDSIASSTGPDKQQLNVTRLVMKVDGITVVDSSATFDPSTAYTLGYDYVPVNTGTTVELVVYGNLEGVSPDSILYRKSDISVTSQTPGTNGTQSETLPYVGPVTGKGDLSITIVQVGLYQVNATTEPIVVPKQGSK